jgi:hypothetical protein
LRKNCAAQKSLRPILGRNPFGRIISFCPYCWSLSSATQIRLRHPEKIVSYSVQQAGDVNIPAEFRLAIYEDLVEQIQSSGIYAPVFRSGDHRADNISGLVTLSTKVANFKESNQAESEITAVMSSTKVRLDVKLSTRDGAILVDRLVEGKVRFFGERLNVIHDIAK